MLIIIGKNYEHDTTTQRPMHARVESAYLSRRLIKNAKNSKINISTF